MAPNAHLRLSSLLKFIACVVPKLQTNLDNSKPQTSTHEGSGTTPAYLSVEGSAYKYRITTRDDPKFYINIMISGEFSVLLRWWYNCLSVVVLG